jgi:CheY-like chemotaxis protein
LGASASSLLALTTEGGEPLDDWRWAAASPQAHLLTDARGTGRLVTLEYWESPEEGATVILRRAGPMHARLRALRELEQTRRTAFADPELMFVHVGPDDRVRSASRGAREQLGVPEGLPSVHDAWAERAGIADVLAEARPVGALEGVRRLRGRQGDALPLAVWVASIPGGGTWFRGLPLGDPGCVPDAPEPAARRPSPRGAPATSRVLVIDEEARIGRSLSRALRDADVELASGGEEGLERVLSAPEAWDLILCDLGTPGVDGVRLHAELRERAPELVTRLVFMAGAIQTERVRRFVQEVAPPLVHKPFDLAEIQAHLDARRRAPSPPSV